MPLDITAHLDKLKAERGSPVYTPPVGTGLQWFDRGDSEPRAAIVTAIERPGVVTLTVFNPNSGPAFKKGVQWAKSAHVKANPHDQAVFRNGTWDYAPEDKPPRSHEQFHARDIERREEALHKQKAEYDRAEANREAAKLLADEEKKKKLQPA